MNDFERPLNTGCKTKATFMSIHMPILRLYLYISLYRKSNCKEFPKCEYIGLTTRPFRNRLAEHKQYVKSKILDTPAGNHFSQSGHTLSHLAGLVLEEVKSSDPFVLRGREFLYIKIWYFQKWPQQRTLRNWLWHNSTHLKSPISVIIHYISLLWTCYSFNSKI